MHKKDNETHPLYFSILKKNNPIKKQLNLKPQNISSENILQPNLECLYFCIHILDNGLLILRLLLDNIQE